MWTICFQCVYDATKTNFEISSHFLSSSLFYVFTITIAITVAIPIAITIAITKTITKTIVIIINPGHGQQDHKNPDGQWSRLNDPKHRK